MYLNDSEKYRKYYREWRKKWIKEHPKEYEEKKTQDNERIRERKEKYPKEYEEKKSEDRKKNKKWKQEHSKEMRIYKKRINERYLERWNFCLSCVEGRCIKCGRVDDLHFHHIKNKSFDISTGCLKSYSYGELKKEVEKCLVLCLVCHPKLHKAAYNYLVEFDKVENYVVWFLKKFKPHIFESYIKKERIEKHHIDLNFKNDNRKNLLFLKKGNHFQLHLRAYDYLVKNDEIDNYIGWFLGEWK